MAKKHANQKISPYLLEYIKLTSFGRYANTIVGPFRSGMNVVFGPNESGKTTINELIRGVLFGWPQNRRNTNAYVPEARERVGSLYFKNTKTDEVVELKRTKNTEEVEGTEPFLSDIDKETYDTMFALTSDELLSLDKHNEVTARLLTAGSGTSSSPAHALAAIEARIKALMSRSSQIPDSISNLRAEQARLRTQLAEGAEEADHFQAQEEHLRSLEPQQETLRQTQSQLNREIETLKTKQARLAQLEVRERDTKRKLQDTLAVLDQTKTDADTQLDRDTEQLINLSSEQEYRLLDSLQDLEERRVKLQHLCDNARTDATKSQADYEVLAENQDVQGEQRRAKRQRRIIMVFALLIAVVMGGLGIYLFTHSRTLLSLSYTIFSVLLIVGGLMIATAGVALNIKPTKTEEQLADNLRKKEWVMQQDQKTLAACLQDLEQHDRAIATFLESHHLGAADGSLRQAHRIMNHVRDMRSQRALSNQNEAALQLQRASLEEELRSLRKERQDIYDSLGGVEGNSGKASAIEALIKRKEEEREQTTQLLSDTNQHYGEISQELQQALHLQQFAQHKQDSEVVEARLKERYRDLARLYLAKHALEDAIADWERKSQPEVYRQASHFFEMMTDGAWKQVRMNAAGEIEVVDAIKTARPPHLLSLGTRQQLYLSLRLALLMTADNVGRALPLLCDDILVNFDHERRRAAIKALCELSKKRQIILFTCHKDVAELIKEIDSESNLVEL